MVGNQVIQSLRVGDLVGHSLRVGDLVGHRQRPERQYEVLAVDGQRLLAARLPGANAAVYCVAGCGGAVLGTNSHGQLIRNLWLSDFGIVSEKFPIQSIVSILL